MQQNGVMRILTFSLTLASSTTLFADWALYDREQWLDIAAHARVSYGGSTGELSELATFGHDPNQELAVQGFEVSASLRLNDHIQGYTSVNIFRDLEDELDAEFEEGFLKLADLPGGFELRGGRRLHRFGQQNAVHLHGWDFVDSNLVTSTFLGEEGLLSDGGDITWIWEGPVTSAFTFEVGEAVTEEEGEEGEEEEEGGIEEAFFARTVYSARWLVRWDVNDFHRHQWGLNFGFGENGYGRDTFVYSADYYYTYRSNGFETGGYDLTVGGEIYYREVEVEDEDSGFRDEADHLGAVASATVAWSNGWEAGLRYDWLEGEESGPVGGDAVFSLGERHRVSANVGKRIHIAEDFSALTRVQVNFDDLDDGDEQSIFLQVGLDWGGPEVR